MKFQDLKLNEQLIEAISYMGFDTPTPIQEKAIPKILEHKDLIACAQTGTGKTAAFILPILHKLTEKECDDINTLIIVPTRELAIQIEQQIQGFAYFAAISSIAVYGGGDGKDFALQKKALTTGTNIIVATPGKLLSHLNLGYINFKKVAHLILDEADRMLDMGFIDDITKIINKLPAKRQNLLFSATMSPKIKALAKKILNEPEQISLALSKPAKGVKQSVYFAYDGQKIQLIKELIKDKPEYKYVIVFSSTKRKLFDIVRGLKGNSYNVEGISSDLEQKEREEVLSRFRNKKTRVLVATDVISRGIDIKDISLVINYDVPMHAEDYVHRVGRTGRASTTGVAITFVNPADMYRFKQIEDLIESQVPRAALPEGFGEGPKWNPKKQLKRNFKPKKANDSTKKRSWKPKQKD